MIEWIIISVLIIWVIILTLQVQSLRRSRDTHTAMMDNVWSWITRHSKVKH
jgi:hypothetical protein